MSRTVLIGLDGMPYQLMDDLSEEGIMVNFQQLKDEGIFKRMQSSIPEVSSTAWSSIITGENPGNHGIYGFTELIEGTYSMRFPDFRHLKAKPFWQKDDRRYVILNVPSTYPAHPLNGFMVSGFVALDLEKATYPREYAEHLKSLNYRIDVDTNKWSKSQELFIADMFDTLESRIITYRYLWDEFDWDVFMLVFTGTDRAGHFLWDAYKNPNHKHHSKIIDFFGKIDGVIGEIAMKIGKEDSLLMMSDHGFEDVEANVNINTVLSKNGFLTLNPKRVDSYAGIEKETKAFALEPGRIYLNREGRYPNGKVTEEDEEQILADLAKTFEELERGGRKVIKNIYRKEDIYRGQYIDKAPDMVLLGNTGFNLRSTLNRPETFEKDHFTGKHTQDNAFLFVKGPDAAEAVPDHPDVTDIMGILEGMR